jgi:hypothetical protein
MTQKRFVMKIAAGISIVLFIFLVAGGCAFTGCLESPEENPSPNTTTTEAPPITTTETPTTSPGTTNNNTQTFENVNLPSGAKKDGLSAEVIVDSHNRYIQQRSYAFDYTSRLSENGVTQSEIRELTQKNAERQFVYRSVPGSNQEFWINSTKFVRATDTGLDVFFSVSERENQKFDSYSPSISSVIRSGDYSAERVVERSNETVIVYAANSATENVSGLVGEDVRDYSSTVLISPDGYVKGFSVEYSTFDGSRRVNISNSGFYESFGSTELTKPSWVSTAIDGEPEIDEFHNENYTSMVHTDGRSLSEGTVLQFTSENKTFTVELENEFAQSDVLYLYETEDGMTISRQEPTSKSSGLESGEYSVIGYKGNAEVFRFTTTVTDNE